MKTYSVKIIFKCLPLALQCSEGMMASFLTVQTCQGWIVSRCFLRETFGRNSFILSVPVHHEGICVGSVPSESTVYVRVEPFLLFESSFASLNVSSIRNTLFQY